MFKTILIIVISVTIFGVLFFIYVKESLKKRLDYYLSKKNKMISMIEKKKEGETKIGFH